MAFYSTNEFKTGLKILIDGNIYSIVENEFVKPGKGQAFNRVKLKNLKTGQVIDRTFKSGEKCEEADFFESQLQFLYQDASFAYFMDTSTFEQYTCSKDIIKPIQHWIMEEALYQVYFLDSVIFLIEPPDQMSLNVKEAEPNVKGDTAVGGTKNAVVETGAIIRVPLFVDVGDVIKVDTKSKSYISRVKN